MKQIPVNEGNSKKIETWGELMTEMEKRNKKKQGYKLGKNGKEIEHDV